MFRSKSLLCRIILKLTVIQPRRKHTLQDHQRKSTWHLLPHVCEIPGRPWCWAILSSYFLCRTQKVWWLAFWQVIRCEIPCLICLDVLKHRGNRWSEYKEYSSFKHCCDTCIMIYIFYNSCNMCVCVRILIESGRQGDRVVLKLKTWRFSKSLAAASTVWHWLQTERCFPKAGTTMGNLDWGVILHRTVGSKFPCRWRRVRRDLPLSWLVGHTIP